MRNVYLLILIVLVLSSCGNDPQENKDHSTISDTIARPVKAKEPKAVGLSQQDSIKATGNEVLKLLQTKNHKELIKYFSADGVLFSPYGFIDAAKSKKLNPSDFLTAIDKNWVLTWGAFDGTGEPIKLTVKAYLQKFVYNADYLNAEAVGYDEIIKKGNSLVNLKTVFPKHHFIDYHFSGFDQKMEGMDWTSLRLVFEKQDDQYFLVAIIHDQWTV